MLGPTYLRVDVKSATGRIDQNPAASPRRRPKTEGLSNRGRHNQSTDPAAFTKAADRQSESSP
ncbi:MAG: hypothetical protein NVS2B15_23650 [Pseudarthrobacter sp.]